MKKIGIWLDREKAHIVTLTNGKERFETLFSKVEFYNPKGGSRSKTRWGPQEVMKGSRYLEREKQQMKKFFQKIAKKVADADALVLFGPGGTNERLRDELFGLDRALSAKVLRVVKADSMTENQIKALIRDFYSNY